MKLKRFEEELAETMGIGRKQKCRFFFKHAFKDIGKHKCHFMLALCSVFIVVLASLVIKSIVAKGPIVFMQLGQNSVGAFDGYFYPRTAYRSSTINTFEDNFRYVNYERVLEVVNTTYNLSPRVHLCGI